VVKPEDSKVAQDNLSAMIGAKILPIVSSIVEQKTFSDEELNVRFSYSWRLEKKLSASLHSSFLSVL
jgi:hypothetical protein